MARTTLTIETALLREIKARAARQGVTLQSLINGLLRQALHAPSRTKYRLEIEGWDGTLQPGVDLNDRNSLYRAMEGR